jgi:hypothetical protein
MRGEQQFKENEESWVRWGTPKIPGLGRLRQEDQELEVRLGI